MGARCSTGLDMAIEQIDAAAGALPGLTQPATAARSQPPPAATCARNRAGPTWPGFAALGIPAVNYGAGDPNLAHGADEKVSVSQIKAAVEVLRAYLIGRPLQR
jgi:succinyl-diaminopimelate desuccinylase